MRAPRLAGRKAGAAVIGLISAAAAGLVWAAVWYVVAAVIMWLYWPKDVAPYLMPAFIIPLLYLPFIAKAVALRLAGDRGVGRIALLFGLAGAVITAYYYLVVAMLE